MASKELSLFHLGSMVHLEKEIYLIVERREENIFASHHQIRIIKGNGCRLPNMN